MRAALAAGGAMDGYTVEQLGRLRLRDGRVEVSSMTSSKGLEFNHVFIAAVEQGRLPYYSSSYLRGFAWFEDRRKFYVSFTRAVSQSTSCTQAGIAPHSASSVTDPAYSFWSRVWWHAFAGKRPIAHAEPSA